jgi:GNAT superfamily N-acetyltransferase
MSGPNFRLGRLVGPEVQALEPLLAAYFAAVPEDPWADVPQDALAWYQILSESAGGLVLVAVAEDRIVGFCVAEVVIDEPNRTRCMMVYAAYVAPGSRSRALREQALRALRGFAHAHGATYLSAIAFRGRALARWLGPDWRDAGEHDGYCYLVGRLREVVPA